MSENNNGKMVGREGALFSNWNKKICLLFLSLVLLFITNCAFAGYAATDTESAKQLLDSSVKAGKIRLCVQNSKDPHFILDYWTSASAAGSQCTRADFSMAMSYLGVDCTPKNMQQITNNKGGVDWSKKYANVLKCLNQQKGTDIKLVNRMWGSWNKNAIDSAINCFDSDRSYSPILIWGHYTKKGQSRIHALLLVGKNSEKNDVARYIIIDPSAATHSTNHVGWMDVNVKTGKSTNKSAGLSYYASYKIERAIQWYNNGTDDEDDDTDENDGSLPAKPSFSITTKINYPVTLKQGKGFGLRGVVQVNIGKIATVQAGVYKKFGPIKINLYTWKAEPNSKVFNVNGTKGKNGKTLNNTIVFGKLIKGNYVYYIKILAKNGQAENNYSFSKSFKIN